MSVVHVSVENIFLKKKNIWIKKTCEKSLTNRKCYQIFLNCCYNATVL